MLCLVPTPIGNLEDVTLRTLQVLKEAELIFCEDTRNTKKLLNLLSQRNNIDFSNKDFRSLHSHNEKEILSKLSLDIFSKNVVYVSDAGMPCLSDPGALLVDFCIKNGISYDVLPGANAVLTAYAMSGFPHTTFSFYGFLPHKGSDRNLKLEAVLSDDKLAILYESPHRLQKLLEELNQKDENRVIFLAKEITKLHQQTFKDSAKNLFEKFKSIDIKGEWVVIVEPKEKIGSNLDLEDILHLELPPKIKSKLIAKMTGESIKEVYQKLLDKMK